MPIYSFDRFQLDSDKFELCDNDRVIELEPRAFRLLLLLIEAEGRLVSKTQIFREVWMNRNVSDDSLYYQVKALRRALDDKSRPYRVIATVHGEGLQIRSEITQQSESSDSTAVIPKPVLSHIQEDQLINRAPRVAALPLKVFTENPEFQTLALGIPDEILASLSTLHSLEVIARASSFQYVSIETPLSVIAKKLEADYCLSGLLEDNKGKFVISVELAEAVQKKVVWSERYIVPKGGIYEVRQDIVVAVAAAIDEAIIESEAKKARLRDPATLSAWQSYHVGMSQIFGRDQKNWTSAKQSFQQAIGLDPQFARALAGLSQASWLQMREQKDIAPERLLLLLKSAEDAIEADPSDPFSNLVKARAMWLRGNLDEAITWFKRSIKLSPSFAPAHGAGGTFLAMSEQLDDAMSSLETYIKLSPLDPELGRAFVMLGAVKGLNGDMEDAAQWAEKAILKEMSSFSVLQIALTIFHAADKNERAADIAAILHKMRDSAEFGKLTSMLPMGPRFVEFGKEAMAAYNL